MASNEDVRLSELVDGELGSEDCIDVIDAVKGDLRLEQKLTQYYLIRDTIKSSLPDSMEHNLRGRVQNALGSEPPLNVVDIAPPKFETKYFASPHILLSKSYAIAASILAVATLSIVMISSSPDTEVSRTVAGTSEVVDATTKVAQQTIILPQQSRILVDVQLRDNQLGAVMSPRILINQPVTAERNWERIQVVPRLNSYVVEHSELLSSTDAAQQNVSPFARVVSFGDNGTK